MWFKTSLLWVEDKWNKFEAWVASLMPGFKTRIVSGLGIVGSMAGVLQEYITGLPLSELMTATQITVLAAILFTLTFWLRGIGERVNVRVSSPTS